MLITCFECRQPLEVSDASAGKRVRCPHCQYVIVAPAKMKGTESAEEGIKTPVTALPPMELDETGDKPLHVPTAIPLPPMPLPAVPADATPKKSAPPVEELPPLPSIDKGGSRRRAAPKAAPGPNGLRWRRTVTICVLVGIIVSAVGYAILSSSGGPQHRPPLPPQQAFHFGKDKGNAPKIEIPNQLFRHGKGFVPVMPLQWQTFQDATHQFKVEMPGQPQQKQQKFDFTQMTAFEVRNGFWEFTVAHRAFSDKEFLQTPLVDRFNRLKDSLCNKLNGNARNEGAPLLRDLHPGREWTITLPDGNSLYVRTFYVRDSKRCHHYVLTARGPNFTQRADANIDRFFNSFDVIDLASSNVQIGRSILEEMDDLNQTGRRESEYTAIAVHPHQPVVAVASNVSQSQLKLFWPNRLPSTTFGFEPRNKPIEQVCFSADGRWLAIAADGTISLSSSWDQDQVPLAWNVTVKGNRCVFTRDHRLLIASSDGIHLFDLQKKQMIDSIKTPDRPLRGLALSADQKVLAGFDNKEILLWQMPEKKLLGTIAAHDAPITAVAFAPNGKTLASASVDRTIKLWDAETCKERATLKQHAWTVWDLAFAPDGKHLASVGLDGMLLVWDVQPQQPVVVWAQANHYPCRSVIWNEQDNQIYFTCKHPTVADMANESRQTTRKARKIPWAEIEPNAEAAKKIIAQCAGLRLPTMTGYAFFSPDGKTVITITGPGEQFPAQRNICIWDMATARLKSSESSTPGGWMSPDGKWVLFSSPGWQIELRLLEVETGIVLPVREPLNIPTFPRVLVTSDSRSVWVQVDNELVRYELPGLLSKQRIQLKNVKDTRNLKIHVARDNQTFLVEKVRLNDDGLRDRQFYDMSDGKPLPEVKRQAGEWSPYVRIRKNTTTHLIEIEDFAHGNSQVIGQQRRPMPDSGIDREVKLAVTGDADGNRGLRLHLWDIKERQPLLTLPESLARTCSVVRLSAKGQLMTVTVPNGWTRIVPMEWLLERKALLPCNANEVAAP